MTGNKRAGFTLIEMLVVAAIFATVFLIGTTVFTNIQVNQRGVLSRQRVVADGRFVLETIARSIRLSTIDYAYYNQNTAPTSGTPVAVLALRDQANAQTCYKLGAGGKVQVTAVVGCGSGWEDITPTDLTINFLSMYIFPYTDPFLPPPATNADCAINPPVAGAGFSAATSTCLCRTGVSGILDCFALTGNANGQSCTTVSSGVNICKNPNIQPFVTMVMQTSSPSNNAGETSTATLQTAAVSRLYRR